MFWSCSGPGRAYLAWNMLAAAEYEDNCREQQKTQANKRILVGRQLENISEKKFMKLYRLNKKAFEDLCNVLREFTELKSSQKVSLESKVLCVLLFYAHGDYQSTVGEANHFSQKAISVYIQEVTAALNHPNVINRYIKFPSTRQERNLIKQRFYSKYNIPGVIGCIDCSHFKIFTPKKEEEHLYFCTKDYYSLNVQVVCDSDCRLLAINAKYGGATDDAFIWENSNINDYMQSLHRNNEIVWLLGDSGYPQRQWLMTPYTDPATGSMEYDFNTAHHSARVVIENTLNQLKSRWRCLHRTLHYSPAKCAQIINACCVLHNIAIQHKLPEPEDYIVSQQAPEFSELQEMLLENDAASDLLVGRALRDQLARRISSEIHNT